MWSENGERSECSVLAHSMSSTFLRYILNHWIRLKMATVCSYVIQTGTIFPAIFFILHRHMNHAKYNDRLWKNWGWRFFHLHETTHKTDESLQPPTSLVRREDLSSPIKDRFQAISINLIGIQVTNVEKQELFIIWKFNEMICWRSFWQKETAGTISHWPTYFTLSW